MEKIGKYLITEHIASGGMAEIYRGTLRGPYGFLKEVVIKAVHPHLLNDEKYVKLFLREARIWAGLNHSNIVQVYEFFEQSGRYYLVMEYVNGVDLAKVIKRSKEKNLPIGVPRTLKIFQNVLSALDYAHNYTNEVEHIYGIVHRDISPQNILISTNGDVKLTDFGIAKASVSTGLTTCGAIVGKIDYMSCEQALGQEVDITTDIFSTGIVLWETLTGSKLFFADNNIELIEQVRRCNIIEPSKTNPAIDKKLDSIVMKALQKDRNLRYKRASEFANEITQYLMEYPHSISDENLTIYMKTLFPELQQTQGHKTEILEEGMDQKETHIKSIIIFLVIFFSILTVLGALLFHRPQNIPATDIDSYKAEPLNAHTTAFLDETTADLFDNTDGSMEDVALQIPLEENYKMAGKEHYKQDAGTLKTAIHNPEKHNPEKSHTPDLSKNGRLSINAIPWADIYIGKKKIGTTPIFNYELKSGTVEIIFQNSALGVERKKRIIIKPDIENKYIEDLTKEE